MNNDTTGREEDRRMAILQHLDNHPRWPADATGEERAGLVQGGFVNVEGEDVLLTSLGELELGYPAT